MILHSLPIGICILLTLSLAGCDESGGSADASTGDHQTPITSDTQDTKGVHKAFLRSDEELIDKHGEGITFYGDDPAAIAISIRYTEGLKHIKGRDVEALPFLEFLESEDWSEGYLPDYEHLGGRASIASTCVAALAHIAWVPGSRMSEEIKQRSLVQVGRVGTELGEAWEVSAGCILATRTIVGERPDFEVTEQPYADWIAAWSLDDRATQYVEKALNEYMPKRYGLPVKGGG